MSDMSDQTRLDLLIGADAIAAFIGVSSRSVYGMAERYGKTGTGIPIVSEKGFGLMASRRRLRDYLEGLVGPIDELRHSA